MADVITRFRLETTQFDSKLRDASKALAEYTRRGSLAGSEFAKVTEKHIEAARALGNIATSATNSKDKLKELVGAFNDVARQYNALTKEQQQSDFGKALADSMQKLSGRIRDVKQEMQATPSLFDRLKDKMVVSIDAMKLFDIGMKGLGTALNVAKDAFFASEENIDNWGRTIETCETIYEGFLTSLNTGDISGFLSRIDQITQAARDAYDELDKLSTQKAIDNPRAQAQRTENERMRAMLRTGRYIAPNDGRRATMAEGTILTAEQKKRIAQQLENGLKKANSIVASEIKQTTKAINALYTEQASVLGMSEKEFRKGTSSMEEFNKRLEGYRNYQKFEREHTIYDDRAIASTRDNAVNPYAQYAAWGVFKDDGKLFTRINELINQRAALQSQNYANTAQAYRAINTGTRGTGGGGGDKNTEETLEEINAGILDAWQKALLKGGVNVESYKANEIFGPSGAFTAFAGAQTATGEDPLTKALEALNKKQGITASGQATQWKLGKNGQLVEDNKKQERTDEEMLQGTQTMIASLQSILGGIESLGIELPKGLTNILGAMQTIIGIVGAIQAMQQVGMWLGIIPHANGGVINAFSGTLVGTTYSGDQLRGIDQSGQLYGLNAGELVLNRAQAGNLASSLQGGIGALQLSAIITGEQLRLVLNNNGRRTGRGEYVTTNFR